MSADKTGYFEKLTADYLPAFFAFGMKNIGDAREAEEFAQETAYQCVLAIHKTDRITNFNAFIWSVAHNTYKRWLARKKYVSLDDYDGLFNSLSNTACDDVPVETGVIQSEEAGRIRFELAMLTDLYRKTIVCFYYEELSIAATAEKLGISVEMTKFYLQKGRKKLKEAYVMPTNTNIGEKSFNPSEFSVYKSAIDFSNVNVWEVFKRKLPCQIALVCHDGEKTAGEIAAETGVPAVYIEEELGLLSDAGVMISPARGKYRTNMHILKKNVIPRIKEQFDKLYGAYVPLVVSAFEKYLPELKKTGVFRYDAPDGRYAWFFADKIICFDYKGHYPSNEDYPQILSCGSKAFIFAEEAKGSPWVTGQTPTRLPECTVWPRDIKIFGKFHFQRELRDEHKAQALYDVYAGRANDGDAEIYAELIEEGHVVKIDGALFCNVAVSTPETRALFDKINAELEAALAPLCVDIRENIGKIVRQTMPPQLKSYAGGFAETWMDFYSGVYFSETLYDKGFLALPAEGDKTPVACYIYKN